MVILHVAHILLPQLITSADDELIDWRESLLSIRIVNDLFLLMLSIEIFLQDHDTPHCEPILIVNDELLSRSRNHILREEIVAREEFRYLLLWDDRHHCGEVFAVDKIFRLHDVVLQHIHEVTNK